ncbi:MAG: hypothetical protein WC123_01245 [Bacilli bacterium]|nr:hypothetical protein [Bacilli bacterium]
MKYSFEKISTILEKINNAGFLAYIVGGTSRDILLYQNSEDIDIASNATPNQLSNIFENANYDKFSAKFGTFKSMIEGLDVEITTFRVEGDYDDYRHPKLIKYVSDPYTDSFRRDFTINAIYMDKYGDIEDFHNGIQDLNNKIIKMIGDPYEKINEDPVRILRALRFKISLNFTIEEKLEKAIVDNADLIEYISITRQKIELQKMLKYASMEKITKILDRYNIDIKLK